MLNLTGNRVNQMFWALVNNSNYDHNLLYCLTATRDVHIYRLVSERTVEENILKKANQKRLLGDMAIEVWFIFTS